MNFPHEKLERTATDNGTGLPARIADHQALLARVIARQASSPSAQDFVAATRGVRCSKMADRSSFLEERMAFFAGRLRSDLSGYKKPTSFSTGCFRPDLAQQEINKMDG